ncbi:unnamed protein product [Prunus armeniaca]
MFLLEQDFFQEEISPQVLDWSPHASLVERELRITFSRSDDGKGVSSCKSHSDAQVSVCAAYS